MDKRLLLFSVVWAWPLWADENPADWSLHQPIEVAQTGITRVALPMETLSNAQASLADLRVMDPSGTEVSFFSEQSTTEASLEQPLEPSTTALERHQTVVQGAVPEALFRQGVTGLVLYSATDHFLKAVTVEGSIDRVH